MSLPPTAPLPPSNSADKITIETPEQTALEFAIAGVGSRFLALAFDMLIQFVVFTLLIIGGIFLLTGLFHGAFGSNWTLALLILLLFIVFFGYFAIFEAIWNGQTPGKRITHIRVIKDSGQPITAIDAVGRNLLRIVDQLPVFYGVGVLCAWISPQSKRLCDYVAGTVVVHEKPFETVAPPWDDLPAAVATHQYGANRLSPEEFALVEAFLSRRSALDAAVRYDTAAGIVRRIESKLTMPPDRPSAE